MEAFIKSIIYIRNSKEPAIDPWGTSHVTFKRDLVFAILVNWTLLFKKKQEMLGVFLLLHIKTVFQVIYYDEHNQRLSSSLRLGFLAKSQRLVWRGTSKRTRICCEI